MNKIRHNLFYMFIYNTALIPIAGLELYPVLTGLAMVASCVGIELSY